MKDNDKMVNLMLRFYPDINKKDFKGNTPLTHAVLVATIKYSCTYSAKFKNALLSPIRGPTVL